MFNPLEEKTISDKEMELFDMELTRSVENGFLTVVGKVEPTVKEVVSESTPSVKKESKRKKRVKKVAE